MATHTYIVSSNSYVPTSALDPVVTIVGSVDGEPVTVTTWLSVMQQTFASGGQPAVRNFVAGIMLAQAQAQIAARTPIQVTQLPTGTFTQ